MNMKIELVDKKIHEISFLKNITEKKENLLIHLKLHHEIYGNNKNKNLFRVRYYAVITVEGDCEINMKYDFDFKADSEITPGFSKSKTICSDAPTIAYPYIKVYVENLICASGYKPIKMPFIDFIESPIEVERQDSNQD